MPIDPESDNHALQVSTANCTANCQDVLGHPHVTANGHERPFVKYGACVQVEVMHDVKDAFLAQDALAVVVALVSRPLMRHADGHMSDRDVLIVQLVVTFLRNLIVIPDSGSSSGAALPFPHCSCKVLLWRTLTSAIKV